MNTNNQAELKEFTKYLTGIGDYYRESMKPAVIKIWISGLRNYGLHDIRNAFNWYINYGENGQFMPHLSDITKIIEGDLDSKADAAWTRADKALRTRGPYKSITFKDPITMLVIRDMGGWIKFCTKPNNDNYAFIEKDFKRRYKDYSMHPLPMDTPKKLTGIEDQSNSQSHIQKNRIEEKPAKKMGHAEVMAKIRLFGLNVPKDKPKKAGNSQ